MDFEFIGKCKNCGSEMRFVLSPDSPDEYQYAIRCAFCGRKADSQDAERFYHLTDTLMTAINRNGTTDISGIIVHDRHHRKVEIEL